MKNFKKLFATVLSIVVICNLLVISNVFAESYCDSNKNFKGGYIDYTCANLELSKVEKGEANFSIVENFGPFANEERCCFNFRALDEVFERYKLLPKDELEKKYESLKQAYNSPFFTLKTASAVGTASLLGIVSGYFVSKSSSQYAEPSKRTFSSTKKSKAQKRALFPCPFITSLILGFGSFIGLFVKDRINKINIKKEKEEISNEIVNINSSNERKKGVLNFLLKYLDTPFVMSISDMFCFRSGLGEDDPSIKGWSNPFVGINYTESEKISFPKKFKEMATKIRKHLKEHNKLDPDNDIIYK